MWVWILWAVVEGYKQDLSWDKHLNSASITFTFLQSYSENYLKQQRKAAADAFQILMKIPQVAMVFEWGFWSLISAPARNDRGQKDVSLPWLPTYFAQEDFMLSDLNFNNNGRHISHLWDLQILITQFIGDPNMDPMFWCKILRTIQRQSWNSSTRAFSRTKFGPLPELLKNITAIIKKFIQKIKWNALCQCYV